jgi:tRNA pseudouridine55 synthase
MNGVLVVDKPAGMTSYDVIRDIKRLFSKEELKKVKIGHCGTLDPIATGVLVILLGAATKMQDRFMGGKKRYEGEFLLGVGTDSDDISGNVISKNEQFVISSEMIEELAKKFCGTFLQDPPIYSARKSGGVKGYEAARRGEELKLAPKEVTVSFCSFKLVSQNLIAYEIECSKGTYIRSIARDLGRAINIPCCVKTLRRTFSEPFSLERSKNLDFIKSLTSLTELQENLQTV